MKNIKKVKFAGGLVTVHFTENEIETVKSSKVLPHPDFLGSLEIFHEPFIHSLNIDREINEVKVSGIELKDKKEGLLLLITGSFKDRNEGSIGLATNPIDIYDNDYSDWPLAEMIEKIKSEVIKYFNDGKKAQTEMDFDNPDN